jgi:hypothetical protein
MLDLSLLIGLLGMLLILTAFFLIQSHKLSQDDLSYDILNFVGSVLLIIYGIAGKAWPFVVLNSVWALYSLKDSIQDLLHSNSITK